MADRESSDDVDVSRRKFLKWAAYVPPTLMGIFASSSVAEAATCNPPSSCNPNCAPKEDCNPRQPCNPDDSGGGGGCNPPSNCGPGG